MGKDGPELGGHLMKQILMVLVIGFGTLTAKSSPCPPDTPDVDPGGEREAGTEASVPGKPAKNPQDEPPREAKP